MHIALPIGKNILIANTETEFIEALNKCISDRSFSDNMAQNAKSLVENKYDNLKICKKLSDFYQILITR